MSNSRDITDRSIFEEFDARKSKEVSADNADDIFTRIAKLTVQNVDNGSLQRIFNLSLAELGEVRKNQVYLDAYADAVADQVERPLDIDDRWDAIEHKALKAAQDGIEYMGPEDALNLALRANKATRRTKDVIEDKSNSVNINTVNIAVPHSLMESLANVNLSNEMQRLMDANAQNKIVDIARPKRIDEMMQEKVRVEKQDEDIMNIIGGGSI